MRLCFGLNCRALFSTWHLTYVRSHPLFSPRYTSYIYCTVVLVRSRTEFKEFGRQPFHCVTFYGCFTFPVRYFRADTELLPAYLPFVDFSLHVGARPSPFWQILRARHKFSALTGSLSSLYWVRLRLARTFCQRYCRLFFLGIRCLLPVVCRFLTAFHFVGYRSVGVSCEAQHLRSILQIFRMDFVPS